MPCRCFFSCEEEAAIQRQCLVALENLGAPDMVWSLWMLYANLNMPYNPFSLQGSTLIFISLFLKPVLLCWRDQCPPSPASWMIATMLEWNYSFVVTQEQINRKHLSFQHSLTVDESCVVFPKFAFKPENYVSLQNTKYLKQYTSIYTSCQLQHFVRGALELIHVHNSKRWCNLFSFWNSVHCFSQVDLLPSTAWRSSFSWSGVVFTRSVLSQETMEMKFMLSLKKNLPTNDERNI